MNTEVKSSQTLFKYLKRFVDELNSISAKNALIFILVRLVVASPAIFAMYSFGYRFGLGSGLQTLVDRNVTSSLFTDSLFGALKAVVTFTVIYVGISLCYQ